MLRTQTEDKTNGQNYTSKVAYTIIERKGEAKPLWLRVGRAYTNRDGSLNIVLDAMPTNGRLQVRDYQPRPTDRIEAA